jgi:hypothetical protein
MLWIGRGALDFPDARSTDVGRRCGTQRIVPGRLRGAHECGDAASRWGRN